MNWLVTGFVILFYISILISAENQDNATFSFYLVDCNKLRMGQFLCPDPHVNHIDPKTQQLKGCTREGRAKGMGIPR